MNYFERHLGDYARDAGHLSMLEHGAYTLLLDRYYTTEQGIPEDQAHRVCRARTRDEKEAVDAVLREFFTLVDGVWTNGRAEREITKMQAKVKAAQENGRRGGRPRQTQKEPTGLSAGSDSVTQQKAPQTPDTKHQTPEKSGESASRQPPAKRATSPAIARPDDVTEQTWADWLQLRKTKKAPVTQTVLNGAVSEAAKAGMSLEEFLQVWCRRGSQGLEAAWIKPDERQPVKQPKSFAQQDREAGMAKWEELTGRTHPDRQQGTQHMGNVIEATTQILEIER